MVSPDPPCRPTDIDDLIQRIQDPKRDENEKKALTALVARMIQRFCDHPQPSYYIEASRLSELGIVDKEQYRDLMTVFLNKIIKNSSEGNILHRDLLPVYNYGLRHHQGRVPGGFLVAPLQALSKRLKLAVQQPDVHAQYHYVFILGALLEIAGDLRVSGLDHDAVHQPLCEQLRDLRKHDEPRLAQVASYAYQALRGVPDNLGPWDVFWRTSGTVLSATTKILSAVSNMDPNKFLEAAPDLFDMAKLFGEALQSIEDIRESAQKVRIAFLQDMERSSSTQIWYDVLHFIGPFLVAGEQSPDAAAKAFVMIEDVLTQSSKFGDKWQFWCGLYSQLEQSWINGNEDMKSHVVRLVERTFLEESLQNQRDNDVRVQGWIDLIATTLNRPEWTIHNPKHRQRSPLRFKKKEKIVPTLRQPFQQLKQEHRPEKLFEDTWKTCYDAHGFYADARVLAYYMEDGRLMIQRLSGRTLDMGSCYVNLSIIEGSAVLPEVSPENSGIASRKPLEAPATDSIKDIQLHELFQEQNLRDNRTGRPKRILIRGYPGVGKTTLCKKIIHDFFHNQLPWDFDRIVWIPLRELQNQSSLEDFLEQKFFAFQPEQKILDNALKRILFAQSDPRTLYLLDGFDEIARDVSSEEKQKEDLSKMFGFLRDRENVIITSRPYAVNPSTFSNIDLELETVGFHADQVQQYLSHAVNQGEISASQVDQIKAFIDNHWMMQGLSRIPILLDALCYTWDTDLSSENVTTMTALYQAIELKLWRRDIVQLRKLNQLDADNCHKRSQIKRHAKTAMELIEEIAFNGLYNSKIELSTAQLDCLYDNLPGRNGETNSTIMAHSFIRTKGEIGPDQTQTFYFIHTTFQEFFAANYFVRCWVNNEDLACVSLESAKLKEIPTEEFVQRWKYSGKYKIMWRFVSGLLCTPKTPQKLVDFMQALDGEPRDLLGPAHVRIMMQCFSEITTLPGNKLALGEVKAWMESMLPRLTSSSLAYEMEFPECILQDTLVKGTPKQKERVLTALLRRAQVSSSILQQVMNGYLEGSLTNETLIVIEQRIASVFARHYDKWPLKIAEAVHSKEFNVEMRISILEKLPRRIKLSDGTLVSMIRTFADWNWYLSRDAARIISRQSPLSEEILTKLFAVLQTGSASEKCCAVLSLSGQLSNGKDILSKLLALQAEDDSGVRIEVAEALRLATDEPEALECLVKLLRDENDRVRRSAATSLETQHNLPVHVLDALHDAIEDEDMIVRGIAVSIWSRQYPSTTEVRKTLFNCLNYDIESQLVSAFSRLSPLSEEIVSSLVTEVKGNNMDRRSAALAILSTKKDLSDEILKDLVPFLEDETNPPVHVRACRVFKHQTVLPDFAIQVLIRQLNSEDKYVRREAIETLANCRTLPETALRESLCELGTWNFSGPLNKTGILLHNQENLPIGILQRLINFLRDWGYKDPILGSHTERILRDRTEFFTMLPDQDKTVWGALFRVWFHYSLYEEDWSCYRCQDSLYLATPRGLHEIPLSTNSSQRKIDAGVKAVEDALSSMNRVDEDTPSTTLSARAACKPASHNSHEPTEVNQLTRPGGTPLKLLSEAGGLPQAVLPKYQHGTDSSQSLDTDSARYTISVPPPTDTIDPSWTIPTINLPSQSRPFGSLNFSSASRSSSSLSSSTTPVTSVTTDHQQQSWLPTPPPQQPLAPQQNPIVHRNNNNSNSLHEDFVLYPSTPASRPQVNLWDENSPASLSASPKSFANSVNNNYNNLVNRRHTLHSSVNVHQLSRKHVQQIKNFPSQSTGLSTSSSYRFSPAAGPKRLAQRLYANSPRLNRPAVPLFNSTENHQFQLQTKNNNNTQHRRVMSSSDITSGTPSHRLGLDPATVSPLFSIDSTLVSRANEPCSSDFPMDLFDLSAGSPLLDDLTSPASSMMQSPDTPFEDFSHMSSFSAALAPPGTVSPKDLALKDPPLSGPPSSFSTDLGTPQSLFESPDGMFSHTISPAFANADYELPVSDNWAPLMTSDGYFAGDVDNKLPLVELSEAKPHAVEMTRSMSSPAPSPGKSPKKRAKTSGITKKASPPKALDEDIKYDPNDPQAAKRRRNTLSARKSRMRKYNKLMELENEVEQLQGQVEDLEKKLAFFQSFAPPDAIYPA
ncbi:hypothetical protein PISL3812_02086 [Talaromyces islandicus]|uniref:NACHT domain-containing protein n=1 Tax=Talaromyces islandicus TaxID=28573 RepID=A0A0U1LP64_TALIS|nr:hypothetical protein PISL3812_02086 [Talaromyces islandicus]